MKFLVREVVDIAISGLVGWTLALVFDLNPSGLTIWFLTKSSIWAMKEHYKTLLPRLMSLLLAVQFKSFLTCSVMVNGDKVDVDLHFRITGKHPMLALGGHLISNN